MNMHSIDFHRLLHVEPGRELQLFPSRLEQLLSLSVYSDLRTDELYTGLDKVYSDWLPVSQSGDFLSLAEKLETSGSDSKGLEELIKVNGEYKFWGYADPQNGRKHMMLLIRPEIRFLYSLLVLEARRQGALLVPAHWTEGTIVDDIGCVFWNVLIRDGIAYYQGQSAGLFRALRAYLQYLSAQPATCDEVSFCLFHEIMKRDAEKDYGAVIDGITLLGNIPSDHSVVKMAINALLESPNMGVRRMIAVNASRRRFPDLQARIFELAKKETSQFALESYVNTMRYIGGKDGFDMLLVIAKETSYGAQLAGRALAWVESYPDTGKRISELCKSDRFKERQIGVNALSERKQNSIFAFRGELASMEESIFFEAVKAFYNDRADDDQLRMLRDWFSESRVRLENTLGETGEVLESRIVSAGGVPIIIERKCPGQFSEKIKSFQEEAGILQ
jgi:hypothetical protein